MLSRQPEIADAFNAGVVSAEHAALIGKFCETHPAECRTKRLVRAGRCCWTPRPVPLRPPRPSPCISRLERIFESDELPPSEDTERNEFHASKTLSGRVADKGDLDAVTGEMLLTALSALTKPRNFSTTPPKTHPARQRADAFAEILRRYLDSGDAPIEGGERPHLSLHVNAADLARSESAHEWVNPDDDLDLFGDKDIARLPHTGPLSIATARRLACDCHLTPIVMDDALESRPQQPDRVEETAPGVDRPRPRLRLPRLRHTTRPLRRPPRKALGRRGPTDLDNLVLLCRYHHTPCCTTPTGKST
ncbi:DUF222 domain-containing protein [Rhodococcus hoagii]|nr:DUF222 domain-containing protein [Prescottella equi]